MIVWMDSFSPAEATTAAPHMRERHQIGDRFKWNLTDIFPDWDAWKAGFDDLEAKIAAFGGLRGTLAAGPDRLLAAYKLRDEVGQLEYKVWYFASLWYDQDQ